MILLDSCELKMPSPQAEGTLPFKSCWSAKLSGLVGEMHL